MSLIDGTGLSLFPKKFIEEEIANYTKRHGKAPKILAVSHEDFIDYMYTCSAGQAPSGLQMPSRASNPMLTAMGLDEMVAMSDLKAGEFELALGWKEK